MADYDMKSIAPDSDGPTDGNSVVFGADSQNATPKPYLLSGILAWLKTQLTGALPGQITNTAPAAGTIGEEIKAAVAAGAAVALTTATSLSITHIDLTPGVWDVYGYGGFIPAASTSQTRMIVSISEADNTLDVATAFAFNNFSSAAQVTGGNQTTIPAGAVRKIVQNGQTLRVYLVEQATFTVSTMTGYAGLRGVRVG